MGRVKLILLVLYFGLIVTAQETSNINFTNDTIPLKSSDSILKQRLLPGNQHLLDNKTDPFHFGVEVGTSVSVDFNGGYSTNLYVAPLLSYTPNAKWQFNVTPVLGRSTFNDMPAWIYPGYATTYSGTYAHLGLYAQGAYSVNQKLYLGASVMSETIMFEQNTLGPAINNLNNIGTSAFVGYKFSDHFRVHAEFGINRNAYRNLNYIGLPPNPFMTPNSRIPYNRF